MSHSEGNLSIDIGEDSVTFRWEYGDIKDLDVKMEVMFDGAKVVFDSEAILSIDYAADLYLKELSSIEKDRYPVAGDNPVYEIDFGDNHDFGTGSVTISEQVLIGSFIQIEPPNSCSWL